MPNGATSPDGSRPRPVARHDDDGHGSLRPLTPAAGAGVLSERWMHPIRSARQAQAAGGLLTSRIVVAAVAILGLGEAGGPHPARPPPGRAARPRVPTHPP